MSDNINSLLSSVQTGFKSLSVSDKYKDQALVNIKKWLTDSEFQDYKAQLTYLIENNHWDYLLDSFYQIIPFGTGGRRGEVGIGPNRINPWTIKSSVQGHSQYLINQYGEEAKKRGVILAYDVRQFFTNKFFSNELSNPVKDLTSKDLAELSAEVYAGNGIKTYLFDDIRTTPQLSFTIRNLSAVGGSMFSASHNPPDHNGQKVYDEYGGQLIPPYDEELVEEVIQNVKEIKKVDFQKAQAEELIEIIGPKVDEAYLKESVSLSLSDKRNIKILYTPLHGCGSISVVKALKRLGFDVTEDPNTSNPSGKFENITFNIPNPEVEQSFETPLKTAREMSADIILSTDPDADRIGVMVNHKGEWVFLNGNEIAAILTEYVLQKRKTTLKGQPIIIKTAVTTDIIREICKTHDAKLIGDLLVGFKYIAAEMNKLEKLNIIDNFLFAAEESHGYISGNHLRDKDANCAAIWLAELAAERKLENETLVDFLNKVYAEYGYFRNYLTEIRLPGAEGKTKIDYLQDELRKNSPKSFGKYKVTEMIDYLDRRPHLSDTDTSSKNKLTFYFEPIEGTISIKVTVRPSGTEPKTKMYFEIGSQPFDISEIKKIKSSTEEIMKDLEKEFMQACYKIIGVDFPDRGFLLFWQLPLNTKLKYFEIEPQIEQLKDELNKTTRQQKLDELLKFLGSDPIDKIDKAFQAKYNQSIKDYLQLN
ncbi:MAG: phospho-sugar mutase [Candidatus Daviesbacteria bacterium]|nr:phospho-sugar mutase [Candidatus Daviesbacteria bacterium]